MTRVIFVTIPADAEVSDIEVLLNAALAANPTYRFVCFGTEWMGVRCAILQEG